MLQALEKTSACHSGHSGLKEWVVQRRLPAGWLSALSAARRCSSLVVTTLLPPGFPAVPPSFLFCQTKPTTSTDTIHTATCLVQSRRRDSDSPASPTQPASEADDRTIGGDDEGDKHDAMTQAATDEAGIQSDSWLDESDEHDDCSFPTGDMAAVDGGRRGSLGL